MKRTIVLIILDGFGIGRNDESNPIYVAQGENLRFLREQYAVTSLHASGISVGLPWGEVGNSEVGHLTIGAGKILYQYFPRIVLAIRDGSFFKNQALVDAFLHAKKNGSAVNFVGLLSKGNVHASVEHLLGLIQMAKEQNVDYKLHLFSDGKDSPPSSVKNFLKEIPQEKISTFTGRYYGMDREENWQLTQKAYQTLTGDGGQLVHTPDDLMAAIITNEKRGNNEEFLPPLTFGKEKAIQDGESVIFFNYREDSIRQIAESFILESFDKFPRKEFKDLWIATMTQYEERFRIPVAFPPEVVEKPLGLVLAENQKTQLRVAETYKYAHITYFFNSYRENPFENEYRVLIPSLNMPHIDKYPQMMAAAITDRLINGIENQSFDFILANYANPDTIAHTGNYEAAIEAAKIVDIELGRLMKTAANTSALLIITSDHGNLEEVINPFTSLPETQHDPNPVPFYLIGSEYKGRKFINDQNLSQPIGTLGDIAPTILELMGIPKPQEMTGQNLLRHLL